MSCEPELLELLASGRLDGITAAEVEAHAAGCATCRDELGWLRAERELVVRRAAMAPMPPELWRGIEARAFGGGRAVDAAQARWGGNPRRLMIGIAAVAAGACVLGATMHSLRARCNDPGHEHIEVRRRFGIGLPQAPTAPVPAIPPVPPTPPMAPAAADEDGDCNLHATMTVAGPIELWLQTVSADVVVTAADGNQVDLRAGDCDARRVELVRTSERTVEARFDGGGGLRSGTIELRLPTGSGLALRTISGDVRARGNLGKVGIHTASGDIGLDRAADVDIETASGDVAVAQADQRVIVHTASGDVRVGSGRAATRVELVTVSGDVGWAGTCVRECGVTVHTVSGEARLGFSPDSSFDLYYRTRSGGLNDEMGLVDLHHRESSGVTARYGGGAGHVMVETTSGDLAIGRR